MLAQQKVIVIAPCYNEEQKIGQVVARIQAMNQKVVDEILIVDDGSTDNSVAVVKKLGASVISLGKVLGVGAALRAGFEYAQKNNFDIIVVMAGNNKDEPNEIPLLLAKIVNENCDFVQGSRFLKKANFGSMPYYRRIATRLHPILFSLVTGKKVTESTNGFRAFRTKLLNDQRINLYQEWLNEYELEPYLYYKVIENQYRTAEVPCTKIYPPKKIGYTKMKPLVGWWSILRPLILLKFGIKS